MSAEAPVRVERDGDVAVVILDDPPLNLFTETTFAGLVAASADVAASDARAMVFRAEGKVFTGGVDVGKVFADVPGSEEGSRLAAAAFATCRRSRRSRSRPSPSSTGSV